MGSYRYVRSNRTDKKVFPNDTALNEPTEKSKQGIKRNQFVVVNG